MSFSHVWPFRKNTTGIPVFYRRHWPLLGKIQSELSFCQQGHSQVIVEAFIYPYLITSINSKYEMCQPSEIEATQPCNHVMQPRLDSKRNRRRRRRLKRNETDSGGDASPQIIEIITKCCLLFIRGARQIIFAQ